MNKLKFIVFVAPCCLIACSTVKHQSAWEKVTQSPKQRQCMAEAIYGEARGETTSGKIFVGRVVLTRLAKGYGRDICSVVYAKRQFAPKRSPASSSMDATDRAIDLGPNGVTHFHSYEEQQTKRASFSVSSKCDYTGKIGKHWGFSCRQGPRVRPILVNK